MKKEILKHDNDPLGDDEKILSNVEVEIRKHPDRFKELAELIEWINLGICKDGCGFILRREDLRYYPDHDGGLDIPFEDGKCWVYAHCPNCGYDLSFPKIMNRKIWFQDRVEYDRQKGVWRY